MYSPLDRITITGSWDGGDVEDGRIRRKSAATQTKTTEVQMRSNTHTKACGVWPCRTSSFFFNLNLNLIVIVIVIVIVHYHTQKKKKTSPSSTTDHGTGGTTHPRYSDDNSTSWAYRSAAVNTGSLMHRRNTRRYGSRTSRPISDAAATPEAIL